MGWSALVVRRASRDHFVAVVRFLGCGVMTELQDWQVERAEDWPACASGGDRDHLKRRAPCASA